MADSVVLVAIDFGTTYSGVAVQFWKDYRDDDPTNRILAHQIWNDGSKKVASNKTPTCLLLKSNGDIDSFGYEAERKFSDLCEDEDEDEKCWYFFRRFKMKLQDPEVLSTLSVSTMIRDEMGKEYRAIEVFSKSIQCLNMKLMEELNRMKTTVQPNDMFYILTVPAIWSDKAKDFMKKAAKMAGIDDDKLSISLEPESASLYCQYMPVERFLVGKEVQCSLAAPGTVYMIVDLGGGTADITVHQKLQNGKLRELHRACGGPWGGTAVDAYFIQLLSSIITPLAMAEFMNQRCGDYLELMRDFEVVKRVVDSSDKHFSIKIPVALEELARKHLNKSFKQAIADSPHASEMKVVSDKLRISANEARKLFARVIDKITGQMQQCFDDVNKMANPRDISLILMVGGFSESKYVQEMIKERFERTDGVRVLIPEEAGLAVLKGAVVFGRHPDSIESRVVRVTYGAEITPPFDPKKHDERKRTKDGKRCSNIFMAFMQRDTEFKQGQALSTIYHTTAPLQRTIALKIFSTEDTDVKYTDDVGSTFVGTLTMKLNAPTKELQDIRVDYLFGDTELKVVGTDMKTNNRCETVLTMNATE